MPIGYEEEEQMITDHINRIKSRHVYSNALWLIMVESNMSWTMASRLVKVSIDAIKPCGFVIATSDRGPKPKPGVRTDYSLKYHYAIDLKREMRRKGIVLASDVCGKSPADSIEVLKQELFNYKQKVIEPTDSSESGGSRIVFSGKGGGAMDDYVMALQFKYWFQLVKRQQEFLCIANEQGRRLEND